MAEVERATEWSGRRGWLGALLMVSPVRRLEEALLGRSSARLLGHVFSYLDHGATVLDAGCGSGYLSLPIAARLATGRVICVDLSQEMLAVLARRARARAVEGRIETVRAAVDSTGLEKGSVDILVSNNLLHELREPATAVTEWMRLLKPGGRIAISDYRATRLTGLIMRHGHGENAHGPFDTIGLASLLERAGFEEVRVIPCRNKLLALAKKPS
ncbi:MAG: methyltransferase domain-containing protein [Actinobacteria bacterium]|nr:methyltransferase domain-containing protein [Actinomycetota bacterium]MDI6831764.1 methyltransferase domain-containing protein [Actinomycetota bacterium]